MAPFSLEALLTLAGLRFPPGLLSKSVRKSGGSAGLGQTGGRDSQEQSGDGLGDVSGSWPDSRAWKGRGPARGHDPPEQRRRKRGE